MKRHDTHLLTEESENKKEEEEHQYSFTSSSEKSSDTHQNYVLNEQKQKSPIKLNFNDNNNNFNNNSIISSSELEDIFNGDNNNINNNKIKPKKKQIKQKKNKLFVKLKKVKINPDNNDILVDHNLTYNPLPNYDNLIQNEFLYLKNIKAVNNKNANKKKNKINSDFPINNTERINNNKNPGNDNDININMDKAKKEDKEKEVLYFFYNDDNEGNKRLKNVIDLINKEKMKLFKVSNKNCFTIKTSKNYFSKLSSKYKNNPLIKNYRANGIERYRYKKDNECKKINYLTKNKFLQKKNKNYLLREKNPINNNFNINNKSNLSLQNPSHKLNYYQSISNDKNNKNLQLYNIYCKNDINSYKKKRIRSTESLINQRQKANILEREEEYPEFQRYVDIHNREKENRKIIKSMFRKSGHYYNDFSRHVGNDSNCPICQAIQAKNENNIKIKGIRPLVSNISNNSTQNSWQNRRIYSALSRVLTKRKSDKSIFGNLSKTKNNNLSSVINKSKSNCYINKKKDINNISKISRISNNKYINNKEEKKNSNNNIFFRKLNISRSIVSQNNFPKSNKEINFKNKNIKYN